MWPGRVVGRWGRRTGCSWVAGGRWGGVGSGGAPVPGAAWRELEGLCCVEMKHSGKAAQVDRLNMQQPHGSGVGCNEADQYILVLLLVTLNAHTLA